MKPLKKIFATALAASMILGMAGCGDDKPVEPSTKPQSSETQSSKTESSTVAETPKKKGKTTYLGFCGRPKTWNPHEWNDNSESGVLDKLESSFYGFKANETKDNFEIYCEAATELPEDITEEFAGKEEWGIPANAKKGDGWAYRLKIRDDLCWNDGTPIKAQDFVESQKRLLDPKMKNYRASDSYDGNVSLVNAKNYYYDGTEGTKKVTWDEVGLKATGEYELTFILSRPCTMFYFCYNGMIHPVKLDVYDGLKKETGDIVKTKYMTSVDTSPSWGPFLLAEYQEDKSIKYVKNDKWFGWSDEYTEWKPDYDSVSLQVVDEHATQLQLFLQGKSDYVGLRAEDMEIYGSSDYLSLSPQTYTTKFSFNTDMEKLKSFESAGVCKTMPCYLEFRKAFSRMVNRKEYCQSLTASNIPGFGLLNRLYLSNPETGEIYRDTKRAKEAMLAVYGGGDIDNITGYDLEEARELFQQAYEKAKADGNYHDGDKIELIFMVYKDDDLNQKIINYLQDNINKATKGTGLEGVCHLSLIADTDYYGKSKTGDFEIMFTTWGGAAMNPYALMGVYCNEQKLNEYGFKPSETLYKATIAGEEYEMTYREWANELLDGQWAAADPSIRGEVMAAIEEGLLLEYRTIPLYYKMSGELSSHRTTYECDEYINNVGFGKTFINMDDEEWRKHVAEFNDHLEY